MAKTETTKYPLHDKDGELRAIHEHVRNLETGEKECFWHRPNGKSGLNGTRLVDLPLYGVHELDDEAVLTVVVEGEKARDALAEALEALADAPVNVVGSITGASSTPSVETLEVLRNHEVILWPDTDQQGIKHMGQIAERLQGIATAVRVYTWHEAPEVWVTGKDGEPKLKAQDAADHPAVQSGSEKALDQLLNDLAGAPQFTPPEVHENGHRPQSDTKSKVRFPLTDLGNAERLVARHGEDLRYVHIWSEWLVWTGQRWEVDDTGEIVRRAKHSIRSLYGEAEAASDSAVRRELAGHATRSEGESRLRAMISLAQSEEGIPVRVNDLDTDPWLLNVNNGTLNLKTGEHREHRREDLITKIAPVDYDPDARCPTFDAFLERILPSEELRGFVQRLFGYALTGDVSAQVLPFFYGAGANGKSTLINTFLSLLGDYGQQAAPELLLSKRGSHPTELADLKGARLVASVEVEDGRRMAESLVKMLTGGERVRARKMRQDFYEFDPTHKLILAANHKPEVQGTDHGLWRRVKLVPFEVTIPKAEQDPHLPEKLQAERSGILAWAVRGCLDWQREGLGEPDEVREATNAYRAEMDTLADFMRERCVVREGVWCVFADLFTAYTEWCEESGEKAETKRRFGSQLKERGFAPANGTRNVSIRRGIALSDDRGPEDGPRVNEQFSENASKRAPTVNDGPRVNEQPQSSDVQNTCKAAENNERVNESYPRNDITSPNSLTRGYSENALTLVNSLTQEQKQKIDQLVSEGMEAKIARAEVLGEDVESGVV